jgi:hypothetical protein
MFEMSKYGGATGDIGRYVFADITLLVRLMKKGRDLPL